MRIGIVLLAACLMSCDKTVVPVQDTLEDSNTKTTSTVISLDQPNVCDLMTKNEIIEALHGSKNKAPNSTWQSLLDEPSERFGVLSDFVGNCYRATPTAESAEQTSDVQFWSIGLGGAAITIEHALEDGSYGGISYVYPAAEQGEFTYVYITSAGFHTQGTIVVNEDQSFTASETVTGHPTITEVRSISRFDETGLTSMTSEFLDNGEWQPGPAFTHTVTTDPFPRLLPPTPTKTE